MKRRFVLTILILVALLSVALPTFAQSSPSARLRVIHAAADVPAVDVYLNDVLVAEGVIFAQATPHFRLDGVDAQLDVRLAGEPADSEPAFSQSVSMLDGLAYSLLIQGSADALEAVLYEDVLDPIGLENGRLTAFHALSGAPAVDIARTDSGLLMQGVTYSVSYGTVNIPAGTYNLVVTPTGAGVEEALAEVPTLDMFSNVLYSIVITEQEGEPFTFIVTAPILPAEEATLTRFVHALPDAPEVDAYINGTLVFPALALGDSTPHIGLPAGEHELALREAGSPPNSEALFTTDITVGETPATLAIVPGEDDEPAVATLEDAADVSATQARVQVLNFSAEDASIEIGDETVEVAAGEAGDALDLTPGVTAVVGGEFPLYGGTLYTVLVYGEGDTLVLETPLAVDLTSVPAAAPAESPEVAEATEEPTEEATEAATEEATAEATVEATEEAVATEETPEAATEEAATEEATEEAVATEETPEAAATEESAEVAAAPTEEAAVATEAPAVITPVPVTPVPVTPIPATPAPTTPLPATPVPAQPQGQPVSPLQQDIIRGIVTLNQGVNLHCREYPASFARSLTLIPNNTELVIEGVAGPRDETGDIGRTDAIPITDLPDFTELQTLEIGVANLDPDFVAGLELLDIWLNATFILPDGTPYGCWVNSAYILINHRNTRLDNVVKYLDFIDQDVFALVPYNVPGGPRDPDNPGSVTPPPVVDRNQILATVDVSRSASLQLRRTPSVQGESLALIPANSQLVVISKTEVTPTGNVGEPTIPEWLLIDYVTPEGFTLRGWVSGEFVTLTQNGRLATLEDVPFADTVVTGGYVDPATGFIQDNPPAPGGASLPPAAPAGGQPVVSTPQAASTTPQLTGRLLISPGQSLNMRDIPDQGGVVRVIVPAEAALVVNGRNGDGQWLNVSYTSPNGIVTGWVAAQFVEVSAQGQPTALGTVPVITGEVDTYVAPQ